MMWQVLGFSSGLEQGVALFVAFVVAVVLHEVAHGYAALRFGDPTAYYAGRLTLNPIKHVDLWGTIIIPVLLYVSQVGVIFGWAKPVPVNYYNLRAGRWGPAMVALAGPATNFALLVVAALAARMSPVATQLPAFFVTVAIINGVLMFFNLIPLPPLDGSKILYLFLENRPDVIAWLERYSFYMLIGVLVLLPGVITQLAFVPALNLTSAFSGLSAFDILGVLR